jgi:septum formation protein
VTVVLASRSPRRTQLLDMLGVRHRAVPSGISEEALPGESPGDQVLRLARAKAAHVAGTEEGAGLVIGADTLVVLGEDVLGQPRDEADAAAMLRRLSGATHTVLTGVCLLGGKVPEGRGDASTPIRRREAVGVSESRVTFHTLDAGEISWYVATGEPMDKAGAYAAQGLSAIFLRSIEGSFHNVVGFPLDLFYRLLPQVGLTLDELRASRQNAL